MELKDPGARQGPEDSDYTIRSGTQLRSLEL